MPKSMLWRPLGFCCAPPGPLPGVARCTGLLGAYSPAEGACSGRTLSKETVESTEPVEPRPSPERGVAYTGIRLSVLAVGAYSSKGVAMQLGPHELLRDVTHESTVWAKSSTEVWCIGGYKHWYAPERREASDRQRWRRACAAARVWRCRWAPVGCPQRSRRPPPSRPPPRQPRAAPSRPAPAASSLPASQGTRHIRCRRAKCDHVGYGLPAIHGAHCIGRPNALAVAAATQKALHSSLFLVDCPFSACCHSF